MKISDIFLLSALSLTLLPGFSPLLRAAINPVANQNKGEVGANNLPDLSYTQAVTAGNQIIVVVQGHRTSAPVINTPAKVSGTATIGAFAQDASYTANSGSDYFRIAIYRAPVMASGTLTLGFSGTFDHSLASLSEYSGMSANPVDGTFVTNAATSATESTGNITTTSAGMVLMSSTELSTTGFSYNQSDTNSYNNSNGANEFTGQSQYKIITAPGTYNLTAGTGNNWFWIAVGVSYKIAAVVGADTQAPAIPNSLSAVAASSSQINLSWTASTDNVGVTGYRVYRGGVQVGASAVTSYTDTGLAASTAYSYTVSAYDAAGNNSAPSSAVQATTQTPLDTQAPTVAITSPASNQTVSGTTTIAANAADNVGVAGVQFKLDGANLGAEVAAFPYSTSWNTSQTTLGVHLLTAVARDAAGNTTTSSGVTVTVSNSTVRTYSTNFALAENPISEGGIWINGRTVGLDWGDVQTTHGLAFGTNAGGFADPTAILAGIWKPDQMVQATVHSVKQNDRVWQEVELRLRSTISAHRNTGYEINFRCSKTGQAYSQIVRWNGAIGDFTYLSSQAGSQFGVANGDVVKATMIGNVISVYINGVQISQVTDNTFLTGSPGMGFYLAGASGLNSDYGFTSFTASDGLATDTTPPSMPVGLSAVPVSAFQVNLGWTASTDNVGVAGYQVFRNNNQIATTAGSAYADTNLVPGIQYTYAVSAFDAAGNSSALSSPVIVATSLAPDITPPSVPTGLQSSNVTATALTLTWSASSDNVAVAGYRVFRNGAQVGTTTVTSYADTGLTPSTAYAYTVAAYDGSNNASAQSVQLSVTTALPALTPPTFIQVNHDQISGGASASVTFNAPTQAGNTIVVYVIWSNTGSVALTDSRGNAFVNVGSPVSWGSGYRAQIFYASNIVGGTDAVTAAFGTFVTSFGVVYVHEYAGISAVNPVDATASASGSSPSLNSGSATTTSVNDLIFGAGVSDNTVTAPGSGFTARDTVYGNITEDRAASTIGSYAATATHNGSSWGMQIVAFRSGN